MQRHVLFPGLPPSCCHDAWEELRDLQNAAKLVVPAASDHDFEATPAPRQVALLRAAGDCMCQALGIVGDAAASASYWTVSVGEIRFQM
jgi:hypothetical protein